LRTIGRWYRPRPWHLVKPRAQGEMWRSTAAFCDASLSPTSIYKLLHSECHRLFPDEAFADLFQHMGRRSIPPRIVATAMVLQRLEGLSDREAADRFQYDIRWKYAAGGLDFEYPGFVHTVLVDMRERLRKSKDPDRIFHAVLGVAKDAGLLGRKRVLDSAPLYDAVATQDTVTMIRCAIRGILQVVSPERAALLCKALKRDDDYESAGKPVCDWDDKAAREALVDELARDAYALLAHMDGEKCLPLEKKAAELLATVVGQDIEKTENGIFRIVRGVAPDRVISTVDPEARHGHKTQARHFDGYKGHIAIDPDSEIITAATVTPGNAADGSVAKEMLEEALEASQPAAVDEDNSAPNAAVNSAPVKVYGDCSYGTGEMLEHLQNGRAAAYVKVQAPVASEGKYTKDAFIIHVERQTVVCPAAHLVQIRFTKDGSGTAAFGTRCRTCPLASVCTESKTGRLISVNQREDLLQKTRAEQRDPAWRARYRPRRQRSNASCLI
jgi:transposase